MSALLCQEPHAIFFRFLQKVTLTSTLTKLVYVPRHTAMVDVIVGGDLARQEKGCDYEMDFLDDALSVAVNINSLNFYSYYISAPTDFIQCKLFLCQEKMMVLTEAQSNVQKESS